jgi:hypothetical protein
MRKLKYLLFTFTAMLLSTVINAQNEKTVGEFMHSRQRSYVVIAVMLTILAGLIIYITRIDRKLSKLEKNKEL